MATSKMVVQLQAYLYLTEINCEYYIKLKADENHASPVCSESVESLNFSYKVNGYF